MAQSDLFCWERRNQGDTETEKENTVTYLWWKGSGTIFINNVAAAKQKDTNNNLESLHQQMSNFVNHAILPEGVDDLNPAEDLLQMKSRAN